MSDIKLFRLDRTGVTELRSGSVALEKSLQTLIERNLEPFLGIRFVASEYSTGKTHAGRIDTLGLDENACPVIIEYKRALNENVINQGLFYLDWLLDHMAEFKLLVLEKFGKGQADGIDWSGTRLLCIAADFTKYDEHAVKQMNRSIELIRYRRFSDDLLLFELVNATTGSPGSGQGAAQAPAGRKPAADKPIGQILAGLSGPLLDHFEALKAYLLALGDDVQMKELKLYVAFRRIRNFAAVEIHTAKKCLTVYVKVDPATVQLEAGFTRDVRNVGHWGPGDLELTIRTNADLEKAKPLLLRSYEDN